MPDSSKNTLTAGDNATTYMSPLGPIPIIGDFFCNPALPSKINTVVEVKPLLINGENLYTISKDNPQQASTKNTVQLQRLSKEGSLMEYAIV